MYSGSGVVNSLLALWLLDVGLSSCFVRFVLLLCLVTPFWYCNHLTGKEGAGCFVFIGL